MKVFKIKKLDIATYKKQILERRIGLLGNECSFLVKTITCFKNEVKLSLIKILNY